MSEYTEISLRLVNLTLGTKLNKLEVVMKLWYRLKFQLPNEKNMKLDFDTMLTIEKYEYFRYRN